MSKIPDLKDKLANELANEEAIVLASLPSEILFLSDLLLDLSSDKQHEKQFIFKFLISGVRTTILRCIPTRS